MMPSSKNGSLLGDLVEVQVEERTYPLVEGVDVQMALAEADTQAFIYSFFFMCTNFANFG